VHFGFFTDVDATRYCYLRLRRLKEAIKAPEILDGLMRQLEVPSDPSDGKTPSSERHKLAAIELQIDRLLGDKTSIWHGAAPAEVLAAAMFSAREASGGAAKILFSDVARKEDLAPPIAMWLNVMGFKQYEGFPPGFPRVDVVAYQVGRLMTTPRVLGIELQNDLSELEPTLSRMSGVAMYTHATYLACTPALAAEFVVARAKDPRVERWDRAAFRDKLALLGFGLLLVEGDAVSESLAPKERKPDLAKIKELLGLK